MRNNIIFDKGGLLLGKAQRNKLRKKYLHNHSIINQEIVEQVPFGKR